MIPGYPDINLASATWANGKVTGVVSSNALPYRLDMDVLARMPDGVDRYARITSQPLQGKSEFTIDCPQKPALISIDPWDKILRPRNGEQRETVAQQGTVTIAII